MKGKTFTGVTMKGDWVSWSDLGLRIRQVGSTNLSCDWGAVKPPGIPAAEKAATDSHFGGKKKKSNTRELARRKRYYGGLEEKSSRNCPYKRGLSRKDSKNLSSSHLALE